MSKSFPTIHSAVVHLKGNHRGPAVLRSLKYLLSLFTPLDSLGRKAVAGIVNGFSEFPATIHDEIALATKPEPLVTVKFGSNAPSKAPKKVRANSFASLERLCAGKRIVCERRGKKIELTTPDGSVTAECESLAEAWDTYRNDHAFCNLPIQLR